ncbi:NAD(P)H-dependent flavin oxidoreductase [Rhodovibrionaceae bacterium A322]
MWQKTKLTELLGIDLPIVQAPLAGGFSTPELIAAVSASGGLGSMGAGYMSGEAIAAASAEIRQITDRPFSINLMVPPADAPDGEQVARANRNLGPYRQRLGLEAEPALPNRYAEPFDEQVNATLAVVPALVTFTFGVPTAEVIAAFKAKGVLLGGTVTTVSEARAFEAAGMDVLIAQGAEAGGHRGTFDGGHEQGLIGTLALVPQIVDAVSLPVIAAGGIMDGRGIAAVRALGAHGAALGTAFLSSDEAGTNATYRQALSAGQANETTVTLAFSGKAARGLRNRFTEEMADRAVEVAAYPAQNALTRGLRTAAAKAEDPDYLSLWAGQGVGMTRSLPAADLMAQLVRETDQAFDLG